MDRDYYREYFTIERHHWWFRARSEILKSYLEGNFKSGGSTKILNVGVATGATSVMLERFGKVVSVEFEQECIEFIKDKVPIEVLQGSITDLPFPDSAFDLVCAFDVIEHVADDGKATAELARVCKGGGAVLVTVPALMSLWGEHDEINHHFKRYKRKEIEILFRGLQGSRQFATYFNFVLFPPIFVIRFLANLFRRTKVEKIESDFEKYKVGALGKIPYRIMKSESLFLNRRIPLPVGVSILYHWKKNG